jgi:hypothetical protein
MVVGHHPRVPELVSFPGSIVTVYRSTWPSCRTARILCRPAGSGTLNSGVSPNDLPSMTIVAYGFESTLY